jgi:hypothetical protein
MDAIKPKEQDVECHNRKANTICSNYNIDNQHPFNKVIIGMDSFSHFRGWLSFSGKNLVQNIGKYL